ncbi:MAG: hypothetical protein IKS09_00500 [Lachnospiraceae bacterium]|nr:hypothetical protein [Lachnospiraceae bacterium]
MSNDSQEVAILLETLQQDILDGINGNDTMYNIIDTLIGKVNERVNTHESTIMTLDSAIDKAMQAGQYDAMDYITLSKQVITSTDRELVEAMQTFQKLLDELNKTSKALHNVEEIMVDYVSKNR